MSGADARLAAIIGEFADLDSREKLELLLVEDRRVHECQTPVFLWAERRGETAMLVAEVAPEAPTVKGFVAILADAINGRPVSEAAAIPDDILERMGLADVLGILRARGLRAILARVKRELAAA